MIYRGGPLDGKNFETLYDDLPVVAIPFPRGGVTPSQTVEHYRLSRGQRVHERTVPYNHSLAMVPASGVTNER